MERRWNFRLVRGWNQRLEREEWLERVFRSKRLQFRERRIWDKRLVWVLGL
jgi:hypothetical protein